MASVIVFGPTGAVGSAAARTAASLGATVKLAMRDTSKTVPGLSPDAEKQGKFTRVTADLTQPETVGKAAAGTTHAFVYCAHGANDGMRATLEALKAAGVQLVVLLSSFTIHGKLEDVKPIDAIPYVHARVEIQLREVFGLDHVVALRPGSFASNSLQFKAGLASGVVKIHHPASVVDGIVPEDIGRVAGTVLAKGVPQDGNREIYLYGPELLSQEESVKLLARELGKNIKIESATDDEAREMHIARGGPPPLIEYMIRRAGVKAPAGQQQVFGYAVSDEELRNVEKYSGHKGTTFVEWVQQNKQLFD